MSVEPAFDAAFLLSFQSSKLEAFLPANLATEFAAVDSAIQPTNVCAKRASDSAAVRTAVFVAHRETDLPAVDSTLSSTKLATFVSTERRALWITNNATVVGAFVQADGTTFG